MGKKRTVLVDGSAEETAPEKKEKKLKKNAKPAAVIAEKNLAAEGKAEEKTAKKPKEAKIRSKRFQAAKNQVEPKPYPLNEAVKLVLELANGKFDETVELNLQTKKEGLTGSVKLPHGTGKTQKIAVFDEKIEKQLQANKTDFDMLIAKPADMGKIAKYARLLGPKGLMPNPKTGTISNEPEKAAAELASKIHYKTEKKAPLIHCVIGKVSMGESKLIANVQSYLDVIGSKQIVKASLSSSMGPGVKIQVE